jgi:hypothetical protein
MSGGPLEAICGAVLFIGSIVLLFCLILMMTARQARGAIGFFILAILFCCFLILLIPLVVFT